MTATEDPPARPQAPAPTVSGRSLRVKGVSHFGSYKRGKVIPQWVAEQSGSFAEELVADGTLEWTDELPAGDFRAPPPKDAIDPAPAMAEELDRLRRRNVTLEAENKTLFGESAALRSQVEKQITALGQQTADLAHYRRTAEEYRLQVAALTEELDLERGTRPAPPTEPAKAK